MNMVAISAKLLTIRNLDPSDYIGELDLFLFDISILGTIAALWVMFVLSMTKKAAVFPHQMTFLLASCQATACVGTVLLLLAKIRLSYGAIG
jgi:hypothetical protein